MVLRVPHWVPVPVEAVNSLTLFRPKKDFGLTAAVITAVVTAIAAATAAGLALSQTVQTSEALNTMAENTAKALDTQTSLNHKLKKGIIILNQRVDLVQEQVDVL